MKIYKGDILKRVDYSGEVQLYKVVQTENNKLHLVSLDEGNRWNNNGINFDSSNGNTAFVYLSTINEKHPTFNCELYKTRKEYRELTRKILNDIEVTKEPECIEPIEFECAECANRANIEEVEITDLDLKRIVAYELCSLKGTESTKEITDIVIDTIIEYLEEKGLVDVEDVEE